MLQSQSIKNTIFRGGGGGWGGGNFGADTDPSFEPIRYKGNTGITQLCQEVTAIVLNTWKNISAVVIFLNFGNIRDELSNFYFILTRVMHAKASVA